MGNQPQKILAVDSDKRFVKALSLYLRVTGRNVSFLAFENAEQAMEIVKNERHDVIVSDYWLAGMNGIEFFHSIRDCQPESRKILMVAYEDSEVFDRFSDTEIDEVMTKPLTGTDIENIFQLRSLKNHSQDKSDVKKKARDIVRRHVYKSVGVGLIPVPVVDFIGHTAIQLNMMRRLAKIYNVPFSKEMGKKMIASLAGGYIPLQSSGIFGSLMKTIPILGQTIGALNLSIFAGVTTYGVGEIFIRYFEEGGSFINFDSDKVKKITLRKASQT